jgi:hypothetical protein
VGGYEMDKPLEKITNEDRRDWLRQKRVSQSQTSSLPLRSEVDNVIEELTRRVKRLEKALKPYPTE